jgi:hypothetical protein
MTDPSLAIIAALKTRLTAAGVRFYDEVPSNRSWPYVSVGPVQAIPDEDECSRGSETFVQLDVWAETNPGSREQATAFVSTIRDEFRTDLTITGHALVLQEVEDVRHERDPRPEIFHTVVTTRFLTEPA